MAGVVGYSSGQMGKKVGDGQCTRLVETALKQAGMKTTADYGVTGGLTVDYKWGKSVSLDEAKPGDIVQFRNHVMVVRTRNHKTGKDDGGHRIERAHHSAVITNKGFREGNNFPPSPDYYSFSILEQNFAGKKWVVKSKVQFEKSVTTMDNDDEVTVEVYGQFWIYRPEPK